MRINRETRKHRQRAHVIMRSLGDDTTDSGGGSGGTPPVASPSLDFSKAANSMYVPLVLGGIG